MKIGRKAAFNVWKFSRTLPDNSLDVNGRKSAQKVGRQGRVKLDALFVNKFMFFGNTSPLSTAEGGRNVNVNSVSLSLQLLYFRG